MDLSDNRKLRLSIGSSTLKVSGNSLTRQGVAATLIELIPSPSEPMG